MNSIRLTAKMAFFPVVVALGLLLFGCNSPKKQDSSQPAEVSLMGSNYVVLGGGCFWCLEAVYEKIPGVVQVTSGYAGGETKNPTYEQVCSGQTGHAEVVRIDFSPDIIRITEILNIFWKAHNPTTLNYQGADYGTQYRSIILYHDEEQKTAALRSKQELDALGLYPVPIVTEIKRLTVFYPAEAYHQDYYQKHPEAAYCRLVILPKLHKLGLDQ